MSEAPSWLEEARRRINETPFLKSIGGDVVEVGATVRARLPYADHLIGDPETGVVHGGVITGLLDNTAGIAVMVKLREMIPIATLDLRIDYMRPAKPGIDIFADCECVRVTHEIAFVRGTAHQGDADDPIALCTAAFILVHGAPFPVPAS